MAASYSALLSHHPPLAIALIANFFLRLAGAATGLLLTLYLSFINRELYPVSATELGFIAGGFYLVEMISAPLLGAYSDRRGRRGLLVLGPLLGLLAVQMTAMTTALGVLLVTRLLEGLSTASSTPALLGYLSSRTDRDAGLRGRVMSLFELGTALGLTLGAVLGTLLWGGLGRWGFVLVGGVYLLSASLFWRVRDADSNTELSTRSAQAVEGTIDAAGRRTTPDPRHAKLVASIRRVLACRPLLRFAPAWLAVNSVVGLWLTHAIFQMTEGHAQTGQYLVGAFQTGMLAVILGGYTLTFGVGALAWGSALGRLGELRAMRLTLTGMLGAAVMIGVINHSGGPGPLLWLGVAGFVLTILLESGFPPAAVSYLARLSGGLSDDRGLLMGVYSVVLGLGQLLGGWLGGPFADRWGMDGILALTFVLGLVAVGLTFGLPASSAAMQAQPGTRGEYQIER
jgi:MFS family permease